LGVSIVQFKCPSANPKCRLLTLIVAIYTGIQLCALTSDMCVLLVLGEGIPEQIRQYTGHLGT